MTTTSYNINDRNLHTHDMSVLQTSIHYQQLMVCYCVLKDCFESCSRICIEALGARLGVLLESPFGEAENIIWVRLLNGQIFNVIDS